MERLKGRAVSPGIVFGKSLIYDSHKEVILREKIKTEFINQEIERFNDAIKKTRSQLKKIYKNLQKVMGKDSALIIETQYMLLKDGNLLGEIKDFISSNAVKTEWAIKEIEKKYIEYFNNIPDLSFREKRNDISDILNRVIENLQKQPADSESNIENVILVADDLPPSVAANLLSKGKLLGLVLDEGGETSHTVILARTLQIPTILNTKHACKLIQNDDYLIVDALNGDIFINPSKSTMSKISLKKEKYKQHKKQLREVLNLPDKTRDNRDFNLFANIELAFECDIVPDYGAKGIGLYRTEFLFTESSIALSVDQQYMIYKSIAQKMFPHPVTIRTYDIGRDKGYGHLHEEYEVNPALGTMAVRLLLKNEELFRTQIKAILKANEGGNIRILFPMVTELEEIYSIKKIIEEMKEELKSENQLPQKDIKMGIMIEIPGTVKLIKHLGDEVDFFSLGTNDLVQYTLAVDRNNSTVSYLYNPFHPAIIEVLFEILNDVRRIGKEVTVCGEAAGKTFTALMLLGMGYQNFSMNPLMITEIKKMFTEIHYSYLKKIVSQLPKFSSKSEIEEFLIERLLKKYPYLFINQPIF